MHHRVKDEAEHYVNAKLQSTIQIRNDQPPTLNSNLSEVTI